MITETERRELLADVRRMARETNACASLCERLAEQAKLREMARRFIAKHGRPAREPLPPGHLAQVIPFPLHRRFA